jgi:hypothetical protein
LDNFRVADDPFRIASAHEESSETSLPGRTVSWLTKDTTTAAP